MHEPVVSLRRRQCAPQARRAHPGPSRVQPPLPHRLRHRRGGTMHELGQAGRREARAADDAEPRSQHRLGRVCGAPQWLQGGREGGVIRLDGRHGSRVGRGGRVGDPRWEGGCGVAEQRVRGVHACWG